MVFDSVCVCVCVQRLRSGSTGVAVLLQGGALTVAWLGDSQALLVRGGQAVPLMEPHKPEREVRHTLSFPVVQLDCWICGILLQHEYNLQWPSIQCLLLPL